MKKLLLTVLFTVPLLCFSQDEDAWIYFKDKPNAAAFLSQPLNMLTQRALDRRAAQNIALDSKDVPVHQAYINQITSTSGISVKAKSKWLNCLHIRGAISDINPLINLSFVKKIVFANRNIAQLGTNRSFETFISTAETKTMETTINFNYGNSANQIQMLNGHLLHQQNFTGDTKIIAVLDAGFPNVNTIAPFQRLRDNNQILGGYNFVDKNNLFYTRNGHGTSVLSTMGGYVENQLVGTAPDAKYYLFITEDANSENPVEESYWVEGAEMADYFGADIITSSLGYFGYDNPYYSHSYSDMTGDKNFASQGANIAFSRGMVVVASAGNEGGSSEPHVGVPAEATNVLAIGAVRSNRVYAAFSSIGPSFDNRVKPDVMAQGQASVVSSTSGSIATANGTSFSGPIMAGMIASFWQAVPWATNIQIVDFVKKAADMYTNPNPQYGYGIPDFQKALNIANQTSIASTPSIDFAVFPNPVSTALQFKIPSNYKQTSFVLFNALGMLINQTNELINNQTIDLSGLSNGLYFYKFQSDQGEIKGKLIKN